MRRDFEADFEHFSADFENPTLPPLEIATVRAELLEVVAVSSAIHSTKGHAAHYLLKAATAFLHTELLLKGENNQAYLNEKLMQGASGLADALIEMQKD